jgi:hypothetical protein
LRSGKKGEKKSPIWVVAKGDVRTQNRADRMFSSVFENHALHQALFARAEHSSL